MLRRHHDARTSGSGDDLKQVNGIGAQVEQTVEYADAIQMQHLGANRRQFLFLRISRRDESLSRADVLRIRSGKRLTVDFSIRRARHFGQENEYGRNHVIRQRTSDKTSHVCRDWFSRFVRNDVSNKLFHTGRIFARKDD